MSIFQLKTRFFNVSRELVFRNQKVFLKSKGTLTRGTSDEILLYLFQKLDILNCSTDQLKIEYNKFFREVQPKIKSVKLLHSDFVSKHTTKINTQLAEENAAAEAKLRQDEEKAEEQKEAVAKPPEDKRPRRSVAKVLAQYLETSRESTPSCSNMIWYTMIAPCH